MSKGREAQMRFWLSLVVVLLLVAAPAAAQTDRSTLRGTVTDPTGAVVPGADIIITDVSTNI
jgi:type 1 fimbria pilin